MVTFICIPDELSHLVDQADTLDYPFGSHLCLEAPSAGSELFAQQVHS